MKCKWSKEIKDEKERLIDLVNTMFPLYIRYCNSRGYNLNCIEWNRNIKPIIESGYITQETLDFCKIELERIKESIEKGELWNI
ncbi:MAG: hypothetical protein SOV85_01910 [Clostridium sp.]|uniref:hypothetical protein n=1 Tax=Clostridium sp. TaxID=1506 RepID=UPI002A74882A|nr:hypothetical protein [Clostridium sp.]MDY2630099.1 hypothetical protein [Clostridium sp.]